LCGSNLNGLPQLLGYKLNKTYGEIMMTHGGSSLNEWTYLKTKTKEERLAFASEMVRQITVALKTLHELGYSHGDLKPENICARKTSEGKMKFTLIDFGLCQKLPTPDKPR